MKHDDYMPEWEEELRTGAWMILRAEPGTEREEWRQELLSQYPAEVVDTFGTDPAEAYAMMDDWWDSETYEDENTGICETYKDWAQIFATEKSVMIYDEFARLNVKLSRLKREISLRR